MKSPHDIAESLLPGVGRPSTCERCGKEFGCGASLAGCWCSELTLSDKARADLQGSYESCLCRECLEAIATKTEKSAHTV